MAYDYDTAHKASFDYFGQEELSTSVFLDKYAVRDENDNFVEKDPDDMHRRLAEQFASNDAEYNLSYSAQKELYYDAIKNFSRIVPQGSPMSAVGNDYQLMSASNCVVVESPEDSVEGIMQTGLHLAQLYKRRCGVGVDLSTLRPDGMLVSNASRTTTGAWSFSDYYSFITGKVIGQKGRRGALMLTLDCHHPDVEKFATMKNDRTTATYANVSVRLSDDFLKAVENDELYEQYWPPTGEKRVSKQVRAKDVWDTIVESATKHAEPGLIMWNTMVNNLPAHCYPDFETKSTNPCSEIALSAFDSCRLISINLTAYVVNPFTSDAYFDYNAFGRDVRIAMRMCDNLVDIEVALIEKIQDKIRRSERPEKDPEQLVSLIWECLGDSNSPKNIKLFQRLSSFVKEYSNWTEVGIWEKLKKAGINGRRTGLGTHGLGDMFILMGVRYDSDRACEIADRVYRELRDQAYTESVSLAKSRGAFPAFDWEKEKDNEYIRRLPEHIKKEMAVYGRRNISLLCQAPTGSVAIVSALGNTRYFNITSGVEPSFRLRFKRRKKINEGDTNARVDFVDQSGDKWQEYYVCSSSVKAYLEHHGLSDDAELPDYFVSSDEIDWRFRVKLQGIEQQYLDHSISSTINLPKGTSPEVVGEIYRESWKAGLKGVTVYVDGSRTGVLVSEDNEGSNELNEDLKKENEELKKMLKNAAFKTAPKRPESLDGKTYKIKIDFGDGARNGYVTVNSYKGVPYEVLVIAPHTGLNEKDLQILELTARTTSMNLRHGLPVAIICEQLDKIAGQYIYSIPASIARILKNYIAPIEEVDFSELEKEMEAEPEQKALELPEPSEKKESLNVDSNYLKEFTVETHYLKCPRCRKRKYRMQGLACGICDACGYTTCG